MPKTKLNIFLAKQGVQPEEVIKTLKPTPKRKSIGDGVFWYKEVADKKPQWLDSFFDGEPIDGSLRTKTIQAVYIKSVKVSDNEDRVFALTFGLGLNLLIVEKFEERFGINTALSLMSTSEIRTADTNTLGTIPKTTRTQLGKLSKISELDLDDEYDLLKSIGGKSEIGDNKILAGISTINGKTSLSLSKEIKYDQIDEMLRELFHLFKSDAYKIRFPGIDHTIEIKDKSIIEQLDKEILQKFNSGVASYNGIDLSCPEIITWDSIRGFKYPGNRKVFDDLSIGQLVTCLKNKIKSKKDIERCDLCNNCISTIDQNGVRQQSWTVYKCLIADIRIGNSQYTLNEGKWYKFEDDYVNQVNDYYNNAKISGLKLPSCDLTNKETERDYNERVAKKNPLKYIHMDKKLLHPEKQTPFEVCDILTTDKEFVHIKKGDSSANLSHLFSQGLVSAELLNNHVQTRKDLISKTPSVKKIIDADNYLPSSYTITYGIITTKSGERPEIPFFSKISFRNASRTLKNMGYKVNLLKIDWK